MGASPFCPECGALNQPGETTCFACGRALLAALSAVNKPGTERLLRQRYRLLRQIGAGGFGAVYQAEDTELGNRLVAVKEMSAHALTPAEAREATEAFHHEALLLARLSHPNLPRIYEQFEEAGHWYLVMDFIEGRTLDDELARRGGRLPVKEALQLGLQLTNVLGYLHSRQPPIVFRDLKPSNVMLTPDGQVYLIDFGIARLFKPGQAKDTIAFGSPGYAAPEQYGKEQTTPRSDVFSLGALLHHLLTGIDPSDTPFRFAPLTMPRPAGLSPLIERMVDLDASKRPATMELVRHDLERMLSDPAPWHTNDAPLPSRQPTLANAQTTSASPRLAPPAPSWQGQNTIQPTRGGPVLPPTPTRQKSRKGWGGIIALLIFVIIPLLSSLGRGSSSGDVSGADTPVPFDTSVPTDVPILVEVNTLAWSPDGKRIAAGGTDGTIAVWDVLTNTQVFMIATGFAEVGLMGWSPDGKYIAAVAFPGREVRIWNAGDESMAATYRTCNATALAWSPDSKRLVLGCDDGTVRVVDALKGTVQMAYSGHLGSSVNAAAWSPNGKYIASGGGDQTVQVWDSSTGRVVYTHHDQQGEIGALAWSPDGKRIASADSSLVDSPDTVQVWDAFTGGNSFAYKGKDAIATTVAWSHDGKYLAADDAGSLVEVWAVGRANPVFTYTGQKDNITAVAWSPLSSKRIASASDDGTVQVWDALTGENVVTYQQP